MKRTTAAFAALILFSLLVVSARASHPSLTCLDIEPDRAHPEAPGGQVDRLTAYVGTNDDDHEEPQEEGCVVTEGDDFGNANIDFEIIGAGDPDAGDSSDSPDMTCTVPAGSNHCSIVPPEAEGDQTIDAWLDNDGADTTTELDFDEGADEATEPGVAEPDPTDVALWTWTQADDRCGEFSGCPNSLTIRYVRRQALFEGRIGAGAGCISGRRILVRRVRPDHDPVIARTASIPSGQWQVERESRKGRYYAVAPRTDDGCERQRSLTIRV